MLSNFKCIPATPMAFKDSVNLTDQFKAKASCRYIYTKQSVPGMHPADKLDDISQMKYHFHVCEPVVAVSQCLKFSETFMDHAFTLILWLSPVNRTILGETAELRKTDDIAISYSWILLTE